MHEDGIDIGPEEVAERHREGELQLVDVREDHEWEAGRIAGARHVPMQEAAAQAQSLDRDRPLVFYCRAGARSAMAAGAFRQAGYHAYSLDGGLIAWAARGLPLEPEDGEVADH